MNYQEIPWTTQLDIPLLALIQCMPVAFALFIFLFRDKSWCFGLGIVFALVELFGVAHLLQVFDSTNQAMQFSEHASLLGLNYHVAVDGMSLLFGLLTAIFTIIILLYGKSRDLGPVWKFQALLFLIEAALFNQLFTLDLLWFTFASTVQIILVGLALSTWSTSPDEDTASTRYLQFMIVAIALLLIGTILIGWNYANSHQGQWSFDLFELSTTPINPAYQSVIFFLLFYGLVIRIPCFPVHGWLPVLAEHGTVAVAPVFLLAIKTGVYGLIRFVFPLLEESVIQWHEYVVAFALTGVFYSAVLALIQTNLRRLLAYTVVSHTGVLIICLFSLSHLSFQGAIMLAINFGLAIAGLLFMVGFVYHRTHTMLLSKLGGLFDQLPLVGVVFLFSALSIIGMPGTTGFDSIHLMLEASIEHFGAVVTITAALGNVIATGCLLWAFQKAFLEPANKPMSVNPCSSLERVIAFLMLFVSLCFVVYFENCLELIEQPLLSLNAHYHHLIK